MRTVSRVLLRVASLGWLLLFLPASVAAQAPIVYRLSFPEPEHRWLQVEATFPDLPPGPVQVRMSRSSPGRYALHEFAKNVFDVTATDARGRSLDLERPSPHAWSVAGHGGTLRVTYRVFGDRVDGTYLAVDSTHAHLNMPATLMWAEGLEERGVTIRLEPPDGEAWRVATQLLPGPDEFTYTAPNLQYLMDSPTELSAFTLRTFQVAGTARNPLFRLAVHHDGTEADVDSIVRDVQAIVSEARHVFGEYPVFEGNSYTFIVDYLPWADGDAMEHRNSTIITSPFAIRSNRTGLLGSVSHEFFHAWNVERIRPRSLEPFDFGDANMSGELWMAEGFTNYYQSLLLVRAGLMTIEEFANVMTSTIDTVTLRPGRRLRTAEEMSGFAPFVDAATAIDRTNFDNTYISYYTWGEAIGLGLDLTLRDRSRGAITLDDYMRALWQAHGKPAGRRPGYVDHPYTAGDLRTALARVALDEAFAAEFFARYIQGHEVVDYARLLAQAGLRLRPRFPGQSSAGALSLRDGRGGVRVVTSVPFGSPAYDAGLEYDDLIVSIGGTLVRNAGEAQRAVREGRPGSLVRVEFERRGRRLEGTLRLVADPRQEVVPVEATGTALTESQRRFRDGWLGSAAGSRFRGENRP